MFVFTVLMNRSTYVAMIANMNEKGRQTKLLAAIAVLAMVVCAFAVVMPSDNVEGVSAPVAPSSYDGEIDASADFNNLAPGDYSISKSVSIASGATLSIAKDVTIWIISGGSLSIDAGATAINLNGTINVMDGGALTYGKALADTDGTINVCKGATVTGPSNSVKVGTSGMYAIGESGFITMTPNANTQMDYTINGTVTAKTAGEENSTVTITAGSVLQGTFGGSGTFVAASKLVEADKTTYKGTADAEVALDAASESYVLYSGTTKVTATYKDSTSATTDSTSVITLNSIVSTDGITITVPIPQEGAKSGIPTISGEVAATSSGYIAINSGVFSGSVTIASESEAMLNYVTNSTYNYASVKAAVDAGITGEFTVNGESSESITIDGSKITKVTVGYGYTGIVSAVSDDETIGSVSGSYIPSGAQVTFEIDSTDLKMDNKVTSHVMETISGTMNVSGNVKTTGALTVPAGSSIYIQTTDSKLTLGDNLTVLGTITGTPAKQIQLNSKAVNAVNKDAVSQYVNGPVGDVEAVSATNGTDLVEKLNMGYDVTISASSPNYTFNIESNVTMNGNTLTVLTDGSDSSKTVKIVVKPGVIFTMNSGSQIIYGDADGSTTYENAQFVLSPSDSSSGETLRASLVINDANLCIPVDKADSAITSVKGQTMTITNAFTSYYVGYGRTAVMDGKAVTADIDVVGTLELSGSLQTGSSITVMQGGKIVVKEGNAFQILGNIDIQNGAVAEIAGTLTVGNSSGAAQLAIETGGEVTVASTGVLNIYSNSSRNPYNILDVDGTLENDGTVNINSLFRGEISNGGTVNVNGVVDSDATVYMANNGAVVKVDSVSATSGAAKLIVSDDGCYLMTQSTGSKPEPVEVGTTDASWTEVNSVSFYNVKGVTVTESVTRQAIDGYADRMPVNSMAISGTTVTPVGSAGSCITVETGTVSLPGEMTLGKVYISVDDGAMFLVSGQLTAPEAGSEQDGTFYSVQGTGTLRVSGTVKSIDELDANSLNIEAAYYVDTVDDRIWNIYTNLKAAIESGAEEITVLGDLYITENTTIPSPVVVDTDGNDVYVGTSDNTEVTLTVEDGGKLTAGNVYVYGTVDIANTDTGFEFTNVISDTANINEDEATALYTNIYNALAGAGEGDVIEITKITADGSTPIVYIDRNVTVPAGATLQLPIGKTIMILAGATVTVEGTMEIQGEVDSRGYVDNSGVYEIGTTGNYFTTKDAYDKKAAIVVSDAGSIVSTYRLAYDDYAISGAYYLIDNMEHISTLDVAAPLVATTDDLTVSTWGSVSAGDIQITGTDDEWVYLNIHEKSLSASSVTLTNARVTVDSGVTLNGTFGSSAGAVELANIKTNASSQILEKSVMDGETAVPTLFVNMDVTDIDTKNKAASVTFTGDVSIAAFTAALENTADDSTGDVIVSSGANVTFAQSVNTDTMKMVLSDLTLTVEGTLDVGHGAELDATATAPADNAVVVVIGTLNVAEKNDSLNAGTASIGKLYVGGTPGDISIEGKKYSSNLGADAAVNGAAITDLEFIYQFPGSTVSTENTKGFVSVQFYFDADTEIVTVWGEQGATVGDVYPAQYIGNDLMAGWKYIDENGVYQFTGSTEYDYADDSVIGTDDSATEFYTQVTLGDYETVYANINNQPYMLVFYVDAGVDAIYVDGDIVDSKGLVGQDSNVYPYAFVSAGTHEITVKLSNGYVGVVEMNFDGQTVTNGQITIDASTYAGQIFKVSITNIDASGTDSTTSTDSGDDGMGLTDYLLIVLVVLIVIMAIMVAVRLMRS